MRWAISTLVITWFAAVVSTKVVDLGKFDQYKAKSKTGVPKLDGYTLWFSGNVKGGVNIGVSPKLQDKVGDALKQCPKKPDNKCYQKIHNALISANIEIDFHGQRRRVVTVVGAIIVVLAAIGIGKWTTYEPEKFQPVYFVPDEVADKAPKGGESTPVTFSAQGTSVVVVTPTPQPRPSNVKGPHSVGVTLLPTPTNKAHYAITIDKDIVVPLNRIIDNNKKCDDGSDFDKRHQKGKRGSGTLGEVKCAAEAVAAASTPDGPLGGLLLLSEAQVQLQLNHATTAVLNAAQELIQFITAFAPVLGLVGHKAINQFGITIFLLVYEQIMDNQVIKEINPIKDSLAEKKKAKPSPTQKNKATSKPSSCPDSKDKVIFCGYGDKTDSCELNTATLKVTGPKCKKGKYNNCPCSAPTLTFLNYATTKEQKVLGIVASLVGKKPSETKKGDLKCDTKHKSDLPRNIFNTGKSTIYDRFCKEWSYKTPFEWRVDTKGNEKKVDGKTTTKKTTRNATPKVRGRSPPSAPDKFKDDTINLRWSSTRKKCEIKCQDAFDQLSKCTNRGSNPETMASSGSLDVGCGTFSYNIATDKDPDKDKSTNDWSPSSNDPWFVIMYVYNADTKSYGWEAAVGDKGQKLDTCGKQPDFKDWDNLPVANAGQIISIGGKEWKSCLYLMKNMSCGSGYTTKVYKCEKKKPDPLSITCKPGDGNGFNKQTVTKAIQVVCYRS